MSKVQTLLDKWPKRRFISDDTGAKATTVSSWYSAGSVPVRHWDALIASARRRRISGITLSTLSEAHRLDRESRAA